MKKHCLSIISVILLFTITVGIIGAGSQNSLAQSASNFRLEKIRAVTDGSSSFKDPNWSPDGKKIAYTLTGWTGLWVYNTEDGNTKKLTDDLNAGFRFQWLPNSSDIVFEKRTARSNDGRRSAESYLKIVNVEHGRHLTIYSSSLLSSPRIGKGGDIFVRDRKEKMHKLFDSAGKSKSLALNKNSDPTLEIVYLDENSRLVVANADGIEQRLLSEPNADVSKFGVHAYEKFTDFDISPDGKKVLAANGSGDIKIFNLQNRRVQKIGFGLEPRWSPDGKQILFHLTIESNDGERVKNSDIYIMDTNGGRLKQLTNTDNEYETAPRWSPDGTKITYYSRKSGKIFIADIVNN